MVFFVCEGCGTSVKKPQVEKHQMQCRNSFAFSCMDCNKHFNGDEFKSHTKCITENEKYAAKGTVFAEAKGEQKQQSWFEQVQKAIASVGNEVKNKEVRELLNKLCDYPNIPRKEAKFKNFLSNSLRMRNPKVVADAWNAISAAAKTTKQQPHQNGHASPESVLNKEPVAVAIGLTDGLNSNSKRILPPAEQQEDNSIETPPVPKKKLKYDDAAGGDYTSVGFDYGASDCVVAGSYSNASTVDIGSILVETNHVLSGKQKSKFNWKTSIKRLLKEQPNSEMKLGKLRKKVMKEFKAFHGGCVSISDEEIAEKFAGRLQKCKKLSVDGGRVKYISEA